MPRPTPAPDVTLRPATVVLGVEQEWAARSLETVLLPRGFAVVRAYSGRQTLDLAETAQPDIVLIDSRLSDMDGVDVCRALRDERRVGAHTPIIMTTSGPTPRAFLRLAYLAGAWSVWEQPLDGELLLLRLQNWVDAKRVADDAERISLIDLESGLYTQHGLNRRAREVMADAARRHTPVSCIAIAPMLSRSGRPTPDEEPVTSRLAAEIGRVLAGAARGSDVVGRTGAGEFAILAPMTEMRGAVELTERLRDRVAAIPPLIEAGRSSRAGLRAGIATQGETAFDVHAGGDLLVRASTALRYALSSQVSDVRTFDEVPATFV